MTTPGRFACLIIILSNAGALHAQKVDTAGISNEQRKFLTLVNANREQSYITFGSGIGNLEPLIFEGKLSPSYFFTGKERKWALTQVKCIVKEGAPLDANHGLRGARARSSVASRTGIPS